MDDLQVPPGNVITYVHHELGRCASVVMPLGELHERCFTHAQRALDGWFEPVAMDEEHYYSCASEETINGEPAVCVARVALAARGAVLAPRPREDAAALLYNTTGANDVIELIANKKHLLHRIEALQLSPLDRQIFECFMTCAVQWITTNVSFADGCVTLTQPAGLETVSPESLCDAS
jgi:hypothetical protein